MCEGACEQLVAEIPETRGVKWKSPLSPVHLLECVGGSRADAESSPNSVNSRKHLLSDRCMPGAVLRT